MRIRVKSFHRSKREGGADYFCVVQSEITTQEVFAFINAYWFRNVNTPIGAEGPFNALIDMPEQERKKIRWQIIVGGKYKRYNDFADMGSFF